MRPRADLLLPSDPRELVGRLLHRDRRVMLLGQPGVGKTTLAAGLAGELAARGRTAWCLGADPGSPGFGVPGAVGLGRWEADGWSVVRLEGLCTLDAARFRLPLVAAVRRLVTGSVTGSLLIDAPGVVRGVAGAELLLALAEAIQVDLVLVLAREGQPPPLAQELTALAAEVVPVAAAGQAHRPSDAQRARRRTRFWDAYLAAAQILQLPLDHLAVVGTPPPRTPEAWAGRQVAFLAEDHTRTLGEVIALDGDDLHVRVPAGAEPTTTALVRDAVRGSDGLMGTAKPLAERVVRYVPPPDLLPDAAAGTDGGPRPVVHLGTAVATLVNGVFDDPLLHLRLRHERRSLLFDLGEGSRLPGRIAHQVSDVFITHAHIDHIGGFLWLLRSRIGEPGLCRLYGPPATAAHLQGLIDGICWDRIGERGPRFQVAELHDQTVKTFTLQAGLPGPTPAGERPAPQGVLLDEPGVRVRAVTLDHGTPVLGFAFEPPVQLNVHKDRLEARGLAPGPWLNALKHAMLAGDHAALIQLPDGRMESVASLAADLLQVTAATRLVYATDFGDTPANRERLQSLAAGAHTLFCESTFLEEDADQARRTGHLTTRACGAIAQAAGVQHLVPFHFSRRYQHTPWRLYDEIAAVCPRVVRPTPGA